MSQIVSWLNAGGIRFVTFTTSMLIQSSVLILLLLALDCVLKRWFKAVIRYGVWLLVLLKLMLPTQLAFPTSPGYWIDLSAVSQTFIQAPAPPTTSSEGAGMLNDDRSTAPILSEHPSFTSADITPEISTVQEAMLQTPEGTTLHWQGILLTGWVVIVGVLLLLLIQRLSFVRGLLQQSEDPEPHVLDLLHECCQTMGIRSEITLRLSPLSMSPSVCGLMRPVILIPAHMLKQLNPEQLRAILLHELAHVKRGDLWVNLLQTLLQVLYFFHPLLWPANAVIRKIREQAVDETVLVSLGQDAEQYPETLLQVTKLTLARPAMSLRLIGVVESKKALIDRIRHITARPFPTSAHLGLVGGMALPLLAVVLLPMAHGQWTGPDGVSWKIVDTNDVDYSGGSQLMRTYMEALLDNQGDSLAQLTAGASMATQQLRLSFNEVEKMRMQRGDFKHSYPPITCRTLSKDGGECKSYIGMFSGGRIKRIDGVRYHLIAMIAQAEDHLWQIKDVQWYPMEREILFAMATLNREIVDWAIDLDGTAASRLSERDKAEMIKQVNRLNEPILKMLESEDKTNTLHGYKVTSTQAELEPTAQAFVRALAHQDWETMKTFCPGSLIPGLQTLPDVCRMEGMAVVRIEASDSFGVVVTEGSQRHDGLPCQLGFTFNVYPQGDWVYNDFDWLGADNQVEFVEGFRRNYPNVMTQAIQLNEVPEEPSISSANTRATLIAIEGSDYVSPPVPYNTVIEAELYLTESFIFKHTFFDFKTNTSYEFPEKVKFWDIPVWMAERGIDAVCVPSDDGPTLSGDARISGSFGSYGGNICKFIATDLPLTCTGRDLMEAWQKSESTEQADYQGWDKLPQRFFFRSRGGDCGIVEIYRLDGLRRTIQFKYVLLEPETIPSARWSVLVPSVRHVLDLATGRVTRIPAEKRSHREGLAYARQQCTCGLIFDHDGELSHLGFINVQQVDRPTRSKSGIAMMTFASANVPQELTITANDGTRYAVTILKAENQGATLEYSVLQK